MTCKRTQIKPLRMWAVVLPGKPAKLSPTYYTRKDARNAQRRLEAFLENMGKRK